MSFPINTMVNDAWANTLAGLNVASAILSSTSEVQTQRLQLQAVRTTLYYGLCIADIFMVYTAWDQEYSKLSGVLSLPLNIDSTTIEFVTNRINALQASILAIAPLINELGRATFDMNSILSGIPGLPDPGVLDFFMTFDYEPLPTGITAENFTATAQAAATAWKTLQTAINQQLPNTAGGIQDSVSRQLAVSQTQANVVSNITISSSISLLQAWNLMIASPALTRMASILYSDPSDAQVQRASVIRVVILQSLQQFDSLIASFRERSPSNVRVITARNNDTLMSIAARELGNFELWYEIAQINAIQPPFTLSGGQQLFLPTNQQAQITIPTTAPNYGLNYLGTDLYYGPLNNEMLPWGGDFNIITGYNNLSFSLGRRLQTQIGSLVYHPNDFGSRIPQEVGKIQTQATAGHISAYASSSILSDPRVNRLANIYTQLMPNYEIAVNATVLPNGIGTTSVNIDQVLQPS